MIARASLVLLLVYSCALLLLEARTSQRVARHYFADIESEEPFLAVNTTLCMTLLWGCALLFLVAFQNAERRNGTLRTRLFYLSQVGVFFVLGFDERFRVHESLGWRLGVGDHFILLAEGLAQFAFLTLLGGRKHLHGRPLTYLVIACIFAFVMVAFDALAPREMLMRLSIEDLSKTWSSFFFFLYGWALLSRETDPNRGSETLAEGQSSSNRSKSSPTLVSKS